MQGAQFRQVLDWGRSIRKGLNTARWVMFVLLLHKWFVLSRACSTSTNLCLSGLTAFKPTLNLNLTVSKTRPFYMSIQCRKCFNRAICGLVSQRLGFITKFASVGGSKSVGPFFSLTGKWSLALGNGTSMISCWAVKPRGQTHRWHATTPAAAFGQGGILAAVFMAAHLFSKQVHVYIRINS